MEKKQTEAKSRAGRIGGSRNTEKQQQQRRQYLHGGGRAEAQKVAEARETIKQFLKGDHKRPAYNRSDIMAWRLAEYIAEARQTDRPLTETGLIVALMIDQTVFKAYADGDRDYILIGGSSIQAREANSDINICIDKIQQKDNGDISALYNYLYQSDSVLDVPLFSDVIQKARLLVTLEREERLAKSGKVSDIFTMKAREGWQDERTINNNILQITTSNATEALQLLGYKQISNE